MKFTEYEHRFAGAILNQYYSDIQKEVTEIVTALKIPLGRGYKPTPSERLRKEFSKRGWICEKQIGQTGLRFDCFKKRVALEIETTDPADVVNDLLKFQIGNLKDEVDVGILIVYDESVKGANLPYVKHAKKLLDTYSPLIHVPIWIIGLRR